MKKVCLFFLFSLVFIWFIVPTNIGLGSMMVYNQYYIPSYYGKTFSQKFHYGNWRINDLKYEIDKVLIKYNIFSESTSKLLIGTAAIESDLGRVYKHPVAVGLFQIEPKTLKDTFDYLVSKNEYYLTLYNTTKWENTSIKEQLKYNFEFQVICSYLIYIRKGIDHSNLPKDIESIAQIWKDKWNTSAGKGTTSKFLSRWKEINK